MYKLSRARASSSSLSRVHLCYLSNQRLHCHYPQLPQLRRQLQLPLLMRSLRLRSLLSNA